MYIIDLQVTDRSCPRGVHATGHLLRPRSSWPFVTTLAECCRSFELSPPTLTGRRLYQNVEIGFGSCQLVSFLTGRSPP